MTSLYKIDFSDCKMNWGDEGYLMDEGKYTIHDCIGCHESLRCTDTTIVICDDCADLVYQLCDEY